MATTDQAWVPEACTLPTADRPLRLSEFDDLFATVVREVEPASSTHARMRLTGPAGLTATVRDLTARETACCSFFTFTVTTRAVVDGEALTFDIRVPDQHADVLAALVRRAATMWLPREGLPVQTVDRDGLRSSIASRTVTLVEALPAVQYDAEHLPGAVNVPTDLTAKLAGQLARTGTRPW
ncbi:hypothetical protein [Micromonospora sp. NPDC005220]|uniref:hypothetical protein n=1 Tax=Micromonospora sp. NPDC005220 TaxID=3155589 RepID=UPI0033B94BD8